MTKFVSFGGSFLDLDGHFVRSLTLDPDPPLWRLNANYHRWEDEYADKRPRVERRCWLRDELEVRLMLTKLSKLCSRTLSLMRFAGKDGALPSFIGRDSSGTARMSCNLRMLMPMLLPKSRALFFTLTRPCQTPLLLPRKVNKGNKYMMRWVR